MDNATLKKASRLIQESHRILLVSHLRPDGDAVGSVLGLGLALQDAGKDVQMVLKDGVPRNFRHLHGSNLIAKRAKETYDCSIVLDCSDLIRTGGIFSDDQIPDVNIDHHFTNLNFARFNLVDSEATATTEILTGLLPSFGLSINLYAAEALLTGLITDSLGFRVAGMSPGALRIAADLFEIGANLPTLYAKALLTRSFRAACYWGKGLSSIQLEDRLLWTRLTLDDRAAAGYPGSDDADLVNILQTIEDADVFVVFIEQTKSRVKVSWRARPGFDVSKIAYQFGGGGHKPAAGAEISGSLDEVIDNVLVSTRTLFNQSPLEI